MWNTRQIRAVDDGTSSVGDVTPTYGALRIGFEQHFHPVPVEPPQLAPLDSEPGRYIG